MGDLQDLSRRGRRHGASSRRSAEDDPGPEGVNVKHNTGESAGQDVFHYHVHVVPRWRRDGLRLTWSSPLAPAHELEQVLERVAAGR
ncbi:HIT family protein [Nonomuraea basaltis]|nr:HIT family protein [Nonomuraea basaltis]